MPAASWLHGKAETPTRSWRCLHPTRSIHGDGGGKAPSVRVPLVGAERVAKALIGWGDQAHAHGISHRPALVNGDPGVVFSDSDGRARWVAALEIAEGVVVAVRSVLNPDKLAHIRAR